MVDKSAVTTSPASLEGLDLAALDRHLTEVGIPRSGELRGELISGGRSNLTFLVADDASKWVLRRPPLHGLTPSAHDMAREYRVVAALQDTPVPVARAVTMRNDDSVGGAPFQMVEYVPGRVVRHADELEALGDKDTISNCVDALIKVLADLHAVDPEAVGLGDFGKPTGYLERQVRRWGSQWELVNARTIPSTPMFDDCIRLSQKRFRRRAGRRSCTAITASTTRCWTPTTLPRCWRCWTGRCPHSATRSATPR